MLARGRPLVLLARPGRTVAPLRRAPPSASTPRWTRMHPQTSGTTFQMRLSFINLLGEKYYDMLQDVQSPVVPSSKPRAVHVRRLQVRRVHAPPLSVRAGTCSCSHSINSGVWVWDRSRQNGLSDCFPGDFDRQCRCPEFFCPLCPPTGRPLVSRTPHPAVYFILPCPNPQFLNPPLSLPKSNLPRRPQK